MIPSEKLFESCSLYSKRWALEPVKGRANIGQQGFINIHPKPVSH